MSSESGRGGRDTAAPNGSLDVLIVSLGSTAGLRSADAELAGSLERAGARVGVVAAAAPREVRTLMLTDLAWAMAARRAAVAELRLCRPRAVLYSSVTAALLWPRRGAIRFDAPAAANRPGRHGVWQRAVETRRLTAAPVVMAMAPSALASLPASRRPAAAVVPVSVDPSGPVDGVRDVDVVAYTGDPVKRRLDVILDAWARARREGETLVVAGLDRPSAPPGVSFAGRLEPEAFRALLRRARVYAAAPRREDFGITPLQALADGCRLVTTPAPGAYPALAIARELDPRLVSDDLAGALRAGLDTARPGYAEQAAALLAPYRRSAVQATLVRDVLPRLLPGWSPA